MLYFCIFVLVVSTTRFVIDVSAVSGPDGYRPIADFITMGLAVVMIVKLT